MWLAKALLNRNHTWTESGYHNDPSLGWRVPSSLNMLTASGRATLLWKSILNSWGWVLIFNISKCKNGRQLVLWAVCIFVYLHLQFTVWHITKNLSDCSEVLPCTYLGVYFSVPERIIKHSKMQQCILIQVHLFVCWDTKLLVSWNRSKSLQPEQKFVQEFIWWKRRYRLHRTPGVLSSRASLSSLLCNWTDVNVWRQMVGFHFQPG